MNRADESTAVEAKPILVNAVKNMRLNDEKKPLTGGEPVFQACHGGSDRRKVSAHRQTGH